MARLKVFLGQPGHSDALQPETDHPVEVRVLGSVLVGSRFMGDRRFRPAQRPGGAGEQVVGQDETGIARDGIRPRGDGLLPAAELPQRFAPLLARENEVGPFGQGLIETGQRFLVAPQAVQDGAAVVEAQGPALPSLVLGGGGEEIDGILRVAGEILEPRELRKGVAVHDQPRIPGGVEMPLPGGDVPAVGRAQPGIRIRPRQRQLVGHLDALEGAGARGLVMAHPAAVRVHADPQQREGGKPPPRRLHAAGRLQVEPMEGEVPRPKHLRRRESEEGRDGSDAERHQHRDQLIDVPGRPEARREHEQRRHLLAPRQGMVFRRRLGHGDRRLAETEVEGVVGADADAVHALHAARIHDHPVRLHLRVDQDVRGADGGAMPALIAGVGHPDLPGRHLVGEDEEAAVGAGVGAEALRPQEVDGHEPADEQERDGHRDGGEGRPELAGHEMVGERRHQRRVRRLREEPERGRPDEHVQRGQERDEDEQPGPERLRRDAHLLHQPGAEVLEGQDVAAPAADETPEDERGQDGQGEEDEPGVDVPVLERVHGLGRLDGRDRPAHDAPLDDVGDHQHVQRDERGGPPAAGLRLANGALRNRGIPEHGEADRPPGLHVLGSTTTLHGLEGLPSRRRRGSGCGNSWRVYASVLDSQSRGTCNAGGPDRTGGGLRPSTSTEPWGNQVEER